jgi:release factor glutamine methyltransferase
MKLKEALVEVTGRFTSAGIEESPLEAELLLRHLLCVNSVELLLEHGEHLTSIQFKLLDALVERRISGEPLAYITGKREFYGREFAVNPFVLIPRPETEHLVEKALEIARNIPAPVIADIGTGSGAIAVTLAAELAQARIYATDISYDALDTARLNARRHGVESRITFLQGDLAEPLNEPVDILIANLPYVRSEDCENSPEPHLALDGGVEGLDVIGRLLTGLQGKIKPGGHVLLEIGQGQAETVKTMLKAALPSTHIETIRDLAGIERVVWGRLIK